MRWLLRRFNICPNAYYNYIKDRKYQYYEDKARVERKIVEIYHKNDGVPGYRMMCDYLAQVLWEHLGMKIPKQDFQELKLYMPLRGTTYYDENNYGDLYQVDYKMDVCPDELAEYKDEICKPLREMLYPKKRNVGW